MIFSTTSILGLVALCITPALAAPIHVGDVMGSRSLASGLEKRSMYFGQAHPHDQAPLVTRDLSEYNDLVARDDSSVLEARSFDDWELEARSFDDTVAVPLAKRSEGEPMRLVRRKSIFNKIKDGFKKAGAKIKQGFQKAGAAIKHTAQKVGQGIKTAAKKVGNFVKTTGAKIAKFGLKVYATATKVASHVAAFIPGIGKPIGKALSGVSKVADFASSKIHANLGKKLEKGMKVMDKIQHPVSGAAGAALDAILKRDVEGEHLYERDLFEGDELFERDEVALEARSFDDGEFLEARSFDDGEGLEARSWGFEDDEA